MLYWAEHAHCHSLKVVVAGTPRARVGGRRGDVYKRTFLEGQDEEWSCDYVELIIIQPEINKAHHAI
jgi:hypothetical protein